MIIKLHTPFSFARQKETKVKRSTNRAERIKADRLVMVILLLMTIIGAAIFTY